MHKSLKILLSCVRFITVALLAMLTVAAPDQEYQDFNPIQPGGGIMAPPKETFLDSISAMKNVTLKLPDF